MLLRLLVLCLALASFSCSKKSAARDKEVIRIGVASSLHLVLQDVARQFESRNPGVEIQVELGGSRALLAKQRELGVEFDALALADRALFAPLVQQGWCAEAHELSRDRIVLARSVGAKPFNDLHGSKLSELLLSGGHRLGMADPAQAPLGYRSLMVLQLQEMVNGPPGFVSSLRAKLGKRYIFPHAATLAVQLEAGAIDFGFLYSSIARQKGLSFIELPKEINLGSPELNSAYKKASVQVAGETPGSTVRMAGRAIDFGVAAKKSATPQTRRFVDFLLGSDGKVSLQKFGFSPAGDK